MKENVWHVITTSIFLFSGYVFSEKMMLQDLVNGKDVLAVAKSKIITINEKGLKIGEIQNARLAFSKGVALTQKCLWFGNIATGYTINQYDLTDQMNQSLSCIDTKSGKVKDYFVGDFAGIYPIKTSDGKSVIFTNDFNSTKPTIVKILDDGKITRHDYSQYLNGEIKDIGGGNNRFVYENTYYDQVGLKNPEETGILMIDENTLEPKQLFHIFGGVSRSMFFNESSNKIFIDLFKKDPDGYYNLEELRLYDTKFNLIKTIKATQWFSDNYVQLLYANERFLFCMGSSPGILVYDYIKKVGRILYPQAKSGFFSAHSGKFLFLNQLGGGNIITINTDTQKFTVTHPASEAIYLSAF